MKEDFPQMIAEIERIMQISQTSVDEVNQEIRKIIVHYCNETVSHGNVEDLRQAYTDVSYRQTNTGCSSENSQTFVKISALTEPATNMNEKHCFVGEGPRDEISFANSVTLNSTYDDNT
jgi:hypothetical protein